MRARWRWAAASGIALAVLAAPGTSLAHPLGNFTINTSAALVLRADEVLIDYVVDMAEIPALQEQGRIDRDGDDRLSAAEIDAYERDACGRLAAGVRVRADGTDLRPATGSSDFSLPAGQAGLRTLRLSCLFRAPIAPADRHVLVFEDANYPDRIGWREVTAAGDGTTILRSSVPARSPSDRLRSYPPGGRPSDVRAATVGFRAGGAALRAQPAAAPATPAGGGLLAGLAARPQLSTGLVALMIVAAIGVGAVHALGPGHGKSLIGASLLGTGGTHRHAIGIGVAVSIMHTASVLGLGVAVLSLERLSAPERVYPWLGLAAGLVPLALGAALLASRIRSLSRRDHQHDHGHDHGHDHPPAARPLSRRGLVAIAFAGGVLPSPTALVVLLASVSIGRTALGLVLIAAFSVGLAASLIAVGMLALRARRAADGRLPHRVMRLAPIVSAGCIALLGLVLTVRGVIGL